MAIVDGRKVGIVGECRSLKRIVGVYMIYRLQTLAIRVPPLTLALYDSLWPCVCSQDHVCVHNVQQCFLTPNVLAK
jgi:hypothetical protein